MKKTSSSARKKTTRSRSKAGIAKENRFWRLVKLTYVFLYFPVGALLVLLNGFFSWIFLIYAAIGIAVLLLSTKHYSKAIKDKSSHHRLREVITWVVAAIIALMVLGSLRGILPFVCENISVGTAYQSGITLGPNMKCVSIVLNAGEMSPWIYTPQGSAYGFTSKDKKPFSVFFGNGFHYHLGVNDNVDFGRIGNYFRFEPDENDTQITIALINAPI